MKKALLLPIFLTGALLVGCSSEEKYVLDDYQVTNTSDVEKLSFTFTGINKKATYDYDFSKSFFEIDSDTFSPDIAKLMYGLSEASKEKEATSAYELLGFENMTKYFYDSDESESRWVATAEDYNKTPMIIGKLVYDDFTLYSASLRGSVGYEWFSDFNMGNPYEEDENYDLTKGWSHTGFNISAIETVDVITNYIQNDSDYNKDTSKLLLMGHSKGGAVANLTGAYLNETDLIDHDNLFVYTFETPNVRIMSSDDNNYTNIFNLINSGDLITMIPLESWGYERYGTDILLPYDQKAISNCFYRYAGKKYLGRENLDELITALNNWVPTYESFFTGETSPYTIAMYIIEKLETGDSFSDGVSAITTIQSYVQNDLNAKAVVDILIAMFMENYNVVNSALGHAHCQEGYIAATSVYYLADYAYSNSSFTELDLSNNQTNSMGSMAISNNSVLEELILPNTLERIDAYAVYNNDKLTKLTVPANVNLIGDCAFKYNKNLKKIYFEGNAPEGLTDNVLPVNATIYIHDGAEGFDNLKHKVKTY
ncbi:MAG: leucine-rich repeat protein [Acholeplasmatales bacterium]|nr:leucine-rich repeat protein [Acholeplasmatales bacterium]